MHAVAIEAFQELSVRCIWLSLLHSVWIGLLSASICALITQAAARLSHQTRHAILLGALALAITGPGIVTILQQAIFVQAPAELATAWKVTAGTRPGEEPSKKPGTVHTKMPFTEADRPRSRTTTLLAESLSSSLSAAQRVRPFVLTAWFFGVAIIASFLALGERTVRRLRRGASEASQSINEQTRVMASSLGLRQAPLVLVHSQVDEPFLCGIVRPVILLPRRLIGCGRSESLDAILAHELAHARRLDHVVNLVQRLVEMVLFFHPAVY
jgi:BlaR1 peptidase M56